MMIFALDYNYNTQEWTASECPRWMFDYWAKAEPENVELTDRLIVVSY